MDPIAVLQNRIEQLEAKLGLSSEMPDGQKAEGDSITANLLNTNSAINNATAGHEKLQEILRQPNELNNYTDPKLMENMQEKNMHMQEVLAAEPIIKHHCHCMHKFKQAAPVLESEAIENVPQMQAAVNEMQATAQQIREESDQVAQGITELAETCGAAAAEASQQLADVAAKVEQIELRSPRRRNGLD